jgi:hypothetical protein
LVIFLFIFEKKYILFKVYQGFKKFCKNNIVFITFRTYICTHISKKQGLLKVK